MTNEGDIRRREREKKCNELALLLQLDSTAAAAAAAAAILDSTKALSLLGLFFPSLTYSTTRTVLSTLQFCHHKRERD